MPWLTINDTCVAVYFVAMQSASVLLLQCVAIVAALAIWRLAAAAASQPGWRLFLCWLAAAAKAGGYCRNLRLLHLAAGMQFAETCQPAILAAWRTSSARRRHQPATGNTGGWLATGKPLAAGGWLAISRPAAMADYLRRLLKLKLVENMPVA